MSSHDDVEDLLQLAALLAAHAGDVEDTRLIGGLAVRLHVGSSARTTRDVDLVAMTDDAEARLLEHLRAEGFQVGRASQWWRAVRGTPVRRIVDVIRHPVVDVQSFQSTTLQAPPTTFEVDGYQLAVSAVDDLVRMKLVAGRDQDLIDLVLLAAAGRPNAREIARAAERDDAERFVAGGTVATRHALRSGALSALVEEVLERPIQPDELGALEALLAQLEKEGL